jgi:hypothetical protein
MFTYTKLRNGLNKKERLTNNALKVGGLNCFAHTANIQTFFKYQLKTL